MKLEPLGCNIFHFCTQILFSHFQSNLSSRYKMENETEKEVEASSSTLRKRKTQSYVKNPSNIVDDSSKSTQTEFPLYVSIIRSVLVLVIFSILFSLYQTFIFKPIFQPESTIDYSKLTEKLCPQGVLLFLDSNHKGVEECNYQLKENWQQLVQNAIRE